MMLYALTNAVKNTDMMQDLFQHHKNKCYPTLTKHVIWFVSAMQIRTTA